MSKSFCSVSAAKLYFASAFLAIPAHAAQPLHNVILFVADGLRHDSVSEQTAPTLNRAMHEGVTFASGHSIFQAFTIANASAMATDHYLGDTGDFSNTIYTGKERIQNAKGSVTPFLEINPVLNELDQRFNGNYLNEESAIALACQAGYSTATIGKQGPL